MDHLRWFGMPNPLDHAEEPCIADIHGQQDDLGLLAFHISQARDAFAVQSMSYPCVMRIIACRSRDRLLLSSKSTLCVDVTAVSRTLNLAATLKADPISAFLDREHST